jgi:sortase (surface protein transpeptidase)
LSWRAAPRLPLLSVLLAMVGLVACEPSGTAGHGSPRAAGAPAERESPEPPHRVHSRADDLGAVRPPDRLSIPSIGVDAQVEQVDFLGVPQDPMHVAWFRSGAAPGEAGTATFDGHLDWTSGPAVFWKLSRVRPGDDVWVGGSGGWLQDWKVDLTQTVPYTSAPPDWLYANSGPPRISIITCDGTWLGSGYANRLLIRAVPAA